MAFSTFGVAKCRHEKLGQKLAATIASYANQREVCKLAGDPENAREWDFAIGSVREEMAANVSLHVKTCERPQETETPRETETPSEF